MPLSDLLSFTGELEWGYAKNEPGWVDDGRIFWGKKV
jgi:hypothetical protein